MKIINSIDQYLGLRNEINQGSTGFVPTMGALHEGHESLVKRSVKECDITVASIYVNPTQFNNADDLANYPDTLEKDVRILESLGTDYLFLPTFDEIYPDNFRYQIEESELSKHLCGAHREGHFTGVLTIVMKLLNIVDPDFAYFGEKDYQQYLLIKEMTEAFFMDVNIISCPTVREQDGLALSSRNQNLDICSRQKAPLIHKLLTSNKSDCQISNQLADAGFDVDYIATTNGRRFAAAFVGEKGKQVRLIDNVVLN
jgi:pantoate--beta-alanine ligase